MSELAYLNGSWCPIEEAKVSIEDRGFQFADGVYEVIVFNGSKPLMLDEHLRRLENSAREIALAVDWHQLRIRETILEGVRRAGFDKTMVYLQITRGPAPRNHIFPEHYQSTVVMTFKPKPVISEEKRRQGIFVMTLPDYRWSKCHIKSVALLANVLAKNEAIVLGFQDAIFVGPGGDVREASSSNVFMIKNEKLMTPPQDEKILHGITRILVLRCAEKIGLPVQEAPFLLNDLLQADEVFLSSTTIDILPVVKVNKSHVAKGQPGRWTTALYQQMLREISYTF